MENKIEFISLNVDGEQREWHMTPSEMYEEYNGECDLPSLNDTIVSCVFAGVHLYFETFSDMVYTFFGEQ
jgi:hypothetical protein